MRRRIELRAVKSSRTLWFVKLCCALLRTAFWALGLSQALLSSGCCLPLQAGAQRVGQHPGRRLSLRGQSHCPLPHSRSSPVLLPLSQGDEPLHIRLSSMDERSVKGAQTLADR